MKRMLAAIFAAGLAATGIFFTAQPAQATEPKPLRSICNSEWYANYDEGDRLPVQLWDGFEFKGNQLVHHETSLGLKDLEKGTFTADPAPSLNSFFSVEVRDKSTNAYGTLRWNTDSREWDLVAKGNLYSHANPLDFIGTETKWGVLTDKTVVISFGVGYVNSPNNGTKTLVKSVSFGGVTYDLSCKPSATVTTVKPTCKNPATVIKVKNTSKKHKINVRFGDNRVYSQTELMAGKTFEYKLTAASVQVRSWPTWDGIQNRTPIKGKNAKPLIDVIVKHETPVCGTPAPGGGNATGTPNPTPTGVAGAGGPTLPLTGSRVQAMSIGAVVVIVVGGGLVAASALLGRRRRTAEAPAE